MSHMRLRPVQKVLKIPLRQSVKGNVLCKSADEIVLSKARVVSEGEVSTDSPDGPVFRGSTMLDVNFNDLKIAPGDDVVRTRELFIAMLRRSIAFNIRLLRLARREAELRCSPWLPRSMETELEFKIEGDRFLVDIDVECALSAPVSIVGEKVGDL